MIYENEVITLILHIAVMFFYLFNRKKLSSFPGIRVFILSMVFLLISLILTILEGLMLEDLLNLLEHVCKLLSAVAVLMWIFSIRLKGRKAE